MEQGQLGDLPVPIVSLLPQLKQFLAELINSAGNGILFAENTDFSF